MEKKIVCGRWGSI